MQHQKYFKIGENLFWMASLNAASQNQSMEISFSLKNVHSIEKQTLSQIALNSQKTDGIIFLLLNILTNLWVLRTPNA